MMMMMFICCCCCCFTLLIYAGFVCADDDSSLDLFDVPGGEEEEESDLSESRFLDYSEFGNIGPLFSYYGELTTLETVIIFFLTVLASILTSQFFAFLNVIIPGQPNPASRELEDKPSTEEMLQVLTTIQNVWQKFDVRSVHCRKRFFCEAHLFDQTLHLWQYLPKVLQPLEFLSSIKFLQLPSFLRNICQELNSAIELSRDSQDCTSIKGCPYYLPVVRY